MKCSQVFPFSGWKSFEEKIQFGVKCPPVHLTFFILKFTIQIIFVNWTGGHLTPKHFQMETIEEESRTSMIINSLDRKSGDAGNFSVTFNPAYRNLKNIRLEKVTFPFAFNNATDTYGHDLYLNLNTPLGNFDLTLPLQNGFYTTANLLLQINAELVNVFNALGQTTPISLHLDPISNRINVVYNGSWYAFPASATFTSGPTPQQSHPLAMLGLPLVGPVTFNFSGITMSQAFSFPRPPSANLPITSVFIHIENLPSRVVSTAGVAAQFAVEVHEATVSGELIQIPNTYQSRNDYFNEITVPPQSFNCKELKISLTDQRGHTLYDQNLGEWSMKISFTLHTFLK